MDSNCQLTFYKRGMLQYSKAVARPGWHLCFTDHVEHIPATKTSDYKITKCRFQNQINHFGSITQWDVHRNSHIGESDNLLHILFVKCS